MSTFSRVCTICAFNILLVISTCVPVYTQSSIKSVGDRIASDTENFIKKGLAGNCSNKDIELLNTKPESGESSDPKNFKSLELNNIFGQFVFINDLCSLDIIPPIAICRPVTVTLDENRIGNVFARNALFSEGFEGYNNAFPIAWPHTSSWFTWNGNQSQSGLVTTEKSYSGSNSLKVGSSLSEDFLFSLGDKTSGKYFLRWKLFIPSGKSFHFNLQNTTNPGEVWNFQFEFRNDYLTRNPQLLGDGNAKFFDFNLEVFPFNYPTNTWFDIFFYFDLDEDIAKVFINDSKVFEGYFPLNLGAINIFSPFSTASGYLDDIEYVSIPVDNPIDGGSSDNCNLMGMFSSPASFDCSKLGANPVTLTVVDVAGNISRCTTTVTVKTKLGDAGTITGPSNVCRGQSGVVFTVPAIANASSYLWKLPPGASGSSSTNSITVNFGASAASGNITVSGQDSCGPGASSSLAIAVNAPPAQPGPITGNTDVCQGSSVSYSIAAVSGATSYTWTLPSGWSGSSTSTSISTTAGAIGGIISVTANNACGSGNERVLFAVVSSPLAQPGAISGNDTVCQGSTNNIYGIAAVTGATSYTWTLPSGWSGFSTSNTIIVRAGADAGTISVTANNACGSGIARTLSVAISSPPVQPGTISGNETVCQGSSNMFSIAAVTGATSYTWTLPSGWSGSSISTSISTTAGANAGTISVAANNACGSGVARTLSVAVTALPVQPGTISGNETVCKDSSNIYSIASVTGATSYTWTLPSGWSGSSTSLSITTSVGANSGNVSVTANNSCGAGIARTLSVDVTPPPIHPGVITGMAIVCQSHSQTYSISPVTGATSYTWTLPPGWSGSSTSNSISTTVGANGGMVSVLANNACGSSPASTLSVSVTTLPGQVGNITGVAVVCEGTVQSYNINPVSGATSYIWTLPAGWTGSSTTTSINATAGANSGTISVTAINSCGGSTASTLNVSVTPLPSQPGVISGPVAVCKGSSQAYSIGSVSGATSYTWTLPSGWSGSSTTTSINATAGTNTGGISVRANNACGSGTARTLNVTVSELPAQPGLIIGDSTVCGGTTQTFSVSPVTGATSYAWTLPPGWSGSSTTSSINTTAGTGSGTISVAPINACGPGPSRTLNVSTVTLPSQPGAISGPGTVCEGTTQTYTINPVPGAASYTWTLPSGWSGTSATTSVIATAGAGSGNITVVANNACGTGTAQTLNVTTATLPVQPGIITGNTAFCEGTMQTFSISPVAGASSYTWTLPMGWSGSSATNSISVTIGAEGDIISVAANNSCGAGLARTLNVSISPLPAQPKPITGNAEVCQGSPQTYSISHVFGATSYTWTLPTGWSGSSSLPIINTNAGGTGGTISVAANNTCGSGPVRTLLVNTTTLTTQPATISGSTVVCSGMAQSYTISQVAGATSYSWTLPPGWSGSSTTHSISTTVGANSGMISVLANNACGSSPVRTLSVSVTTLPGQPGNITGSAIVCEGTVQSYNISPVSGATSYVWALPAGWTGSSATTSINATAGANSGTISVTAFNSCGGVTGAALNVSATPIPSQPGAISGPVAVCKGSSQAYSIGSVPGATSYTWTLPSGWSGSSTTTSINATAGTNTGVISVRANNACGSGTTRTLDVTVSELPAQPGLITGAATVCEGTTQTFSVSPVTGATSYVWTLPPGWSGSSTTSSINTTAGTGSGTILVAPINACGSGPSRTLNVTTLSLPSQPGAVSGPGTVCEGTTQTYTINPVTGALSYTWTLPNGWSGSSNTNSINLTSGSNSGKVSVVANNVCGSGKATEVTINVQQLPQAAGIISGSNSVCQRTDSVVYSVPLISGASTYIWTLPPGASGSSTTNSISVNFDSTAVSGNIIVKGQNQCASGKASTLKVNVVSAPPKPVITQSGNILTSSSATNNQWYDAKGAINSATAQNFTPLADGSYYVIVTTGGCSSAPSNTINVKLTNTEALEHLLGITIYPNPVSGLLTIEIDRTTEPIRIEIFNALGQLVHESVFHNKTTVATSQFTSGIYLLKLQKGKALAFKKFVKE